MTEKRFTVPIKYRFSHSKIQLNGEPLTNDELVRILNTNDGAFFENFSLKQENEQLNQIISNYEKTIDKVFDNIVFADKNAIQSLKKQLKEELKE